MTSADKIREKAYELWEARGRPDGTPGEDWLKAETLLRSAQHPLWAQGVSAGLSALFERFLSTPPRGQRPPWESRAYVSFTLSEQDDPP